MPEMPEMPGKKETVKVSIMRREVTVACERGERRNVVEAAAYLDKKMREVARGRRPLDSERVAIVAGLNISDELLKLRKSADEQGAVEERLEELHQQVDDAVISGRRAAGGVAGA